MKYLFARKDLKVLCIQYTDNVAVELHDYLHDLGWKMEKSEFMYYWSGTDRYGGKVNKYSFNSNTKIAI